MLLGVGRERRKEGERKMDGEEEKFEWPEFNCTSIAINLLTDLLKEVLTNLAS